MRDPYNEQGLAAALSVLPAWSGDRTRISRTVLLPPDADARLRAAVARVADELDHHPVLEELPDGRCRLVLWTHVRGCVTELDVALARRLDALLP